MKRNFAIALLLLAASALASAQIHGVPPSVTSFGPGRGPAPGVRASVTSLGPHGWSGGFFDGRFHRGSGRDFDRNRFGHRFRDRDFHQHYFPVWGASYWPYYGFDYALDGYNGDPYDQQPNQPVVVVEGRGGDSRYGDHSFAEDPGPPPPQAQPQAPPPLPEEQEPTVLVFRDGHKQEVRNYAIVGSMLWEFDAKGTHKIPVSDIDVEATRKLNDEHGVDFTLPRT
jgi:hypothetical protein